MSDVVAVQTLRRLPQRTVDLVRRLGTRWVGLLVDLLAVSLSWLLVLPSYRTIVDDALLTDAPSVALVQVLLLMVVGSALHVYPDRYGYGSFDEALRLSLTVTTTTSLTALGAAAFDAAVPGTAVVAAGLVMLTVVLASRWTGRALRDRHRRPCAPRHRAVVFGAGDGGSRIVRELRGTRTSAYAPVAVLDDDPRKYGHRLSGVPVAGGRDRLAEVVGRTDADMLLIAVPSASGDLLADLTTRGAALGLRVTRLPSVEELICEDLREADIRAVSLADLLGRHEARFDVTAVADYLVGRTVLVTGAGGSIGSELCRQISRFAVRELIMLDRDESALHGVQLALLGRALLDDDRVVVADIRDRYRVDDIFAERRPDVVFHTAALKHLPLLEQYPSEAVKSNAWGTQNLLTAASRHGVDRFVNISTDKAADPVSVLGMSKRIGERLTAAADRAVDGTFLSVRFGNVLGSRGSVLTAFQAQIDAGGPVTVTHPEVTRYFMTVEEAVALVLQAGAVGTGGQVLVLDMGEPVRIRHVAERLVEASGAQVPIVYTGLRAGEKLHEVLLGPGEVDLRPSHPLLSQVDVPPLDEEALHSLNGIRDPSALRAALAELVVRAPVAASVRRVIDLGEPQERRAAV